MEDLISVIVPVYGVEDYLAACVESIRRQSYQNLEILLIDDGSRDACPRICEELAAGDRRIRVFHKENGGLSDARNYGIQKARGEWLGFIDSDDTISPDMYRAMWQAASQNGADLAVCGLQAVEMNGDIRYSSLLEDQVLTGWSLMEQFLKSREDNDYAVNKLYKKSLFEGISYPVGHYYEDAWTTYKLLDRCKKAVTVSEVGYFYRMRPESICRSSSMEKHLDGVNAKLQKLSFIQEHSPRLAPYMERELLEFIKSMYLIYDDMGPDKDPAVGKKLHHIYKSHLKEAARLSGTDRLILPLMGWWPWGYCRLIQLAALWKRR